MPIEIRELIIRAVVDREERPAGDSESEGDGRKVIRDSVEQVMEILERRKER